MNGAGNEQLGVNHWITSTVDWKMARKGHWSRASSRWWMNYVAQSSCDARGHWHDEWISNPFLIHFYFSNINQWRSSWSILQGDFHWMTCDSLILIDSNNNNSIVIHVRSYPQIFAILWIKTISDKNSFTNRSYKGKHMISSMNYCGIPLSCIMLNSSVR